MTVSNSSAEMHQAKKQRQDVEKLLHKQKLQSLAYKDDLDANNTHSEQSLLLKSSSDKSSSDNTINNMNMVAAVTTPTNTNEILLVEPSTQHNEVPNVKKKESNFVDVINETTNDLDSKENNPNNNSSKIYEETEIQRLAYFFVVLLLQNGVFVSFN